MKTGVSIKGGDVDREAADAVAKAIRTIFDAAAENNMDQDTVRAALTTLSNLGLVKDVSIYNATIGDRG